MGGFACGPVVMATPVLLGVVGLPVSAKSACFALSCTTFSRHHPATSKPGSCSCSLPLFFISVYSLQFSFSSSSWHPLACWSNALSNFAFLFPVIKAQPPVSISSSPSLCRRDLFPPTTFTPNTSPDGICSCVTPQPFDELHMSVHCEQHPLLKPHAPSTNHPACTTHYRPCLLCCSPKSQLGECQDVRRFYVLRRVA